MTEKTGTVEKMESSSEIARALLKSSGFTVRTTLDSRTSDQTFTTVASRDEYVARARRLGAEIEFPQKTRR